MSGPDDIDDCTSVDNSSPHGSTTFNSTFLGKQKARFTLTLSISMDKRQRVTSRSVTTMAAAMKQTAETMTNISKLLNCLAVCNELVRQLLATLHRLLYENDVVADTRNSVNSNFEKFKHFLRSHSVRCSSNSFSSNIRRLLSSTSCRFRLNAIEPRVDSTVPVPDAPGGTLNSLVLFFARIVIIYVTSFLLSFVICQFLFAVCLLHIRLSIQMCRLQRMIAAKNKMCRVLRKFCHANCINTLKSLTAHTKQSKQFDCSSLFDGRGFTAPTMKRAIVVRMVQMLLKTDRRAASCTAQSSSNASTVTANSSNIRQTHITHTTSQSHQLRTEPTSSTLPTSSDATSDQRVSKVRNNVNITHRSVIASSMSMTTTSARKPSNNSVNASRTPISQPENVVRVVKAPTQPILQNVLRRVVSNASGPTETASFGKQIGQNLFICNTDGKLIRLTPLNASATATNTESSATMVGGISTPTLRTTTLPFNTFMVANTATVATTSSPTKQFVSSTRSIYEETYAKFLKSNESVVSVQGEHVVKSSNDASTLKQSSTQTTTIIQCQPMLKPGTIIANPAKSMSANIVVTSGAPGVGAVNANNKQALVGLPSIIQVPRTIRPLQNLSLAKELTTVATTKVQMTENVSNGDAVASGIDTSTNANQFRITFPLISSSSGRKVHLHAGTVPFDAQKVILTGTTTAPQPQRVQTFERAKLIAKKSTNSSHRNVDHFTMEQLREFDMVLERVKERSTVATVTTISNTTSMVQSPKPKILTTNCTPNGLSHQQQRVSVVGGNGQSIATSSGLFQKINLAILKKGTAAETKKNNAPKVSNPQPIGVVATTNCTPSNVNNVILSPTIVNNMNLQPSPKPSELMQTRIKIERTEQCEPSDTEVSPLDSLTGHGNHKVMVKSIAELSPSKSQQQPQQQQTKNNFSPVSSTSTSSTSTSKPSNKSQEDEQTVQRIYDILAQYAEQISSSPDLINKPAPRRRNNLVSSVPAQTSVASGKLSGTSTLSKATSTVTTACLNPVNSCESSPQSAFASSQVNCRKRNKSTNGSGSIDSHDYNDTNDEVDAAPEKRPRSTFLNTNSKSMMDHHDYIITTQNASSLSTVANVLNSNGTFKTNRFVLSNGITEPLTIGIPSGNDGGGVTTTPSSNDAMPSQTVNVLISGNYLLPMGMIKSNTIGTNETVICTTTPTNKRNSTGQVLCPNLATFMFSRNASHFHATTTATIDATNKLTARTPILNNQKIQFQAIRMAQPNGNDGKSIATTIGSGATDSTTFPSTLLLPAVKTEPSSVVERAVNEFQVSVDGDASSKFTSQLFQSNRGIVILNKKHVNHVNPNATTTMTVASPTGATTTAVPAIIITTTATLTTTSTATTAVSSTTLPSTLSSKANSHTKNDFLLPINQPTSPRSDDDTSQNIALTFADESNVMFEEVHQELLNDTSHQYHDQMFNNETDNDQVAMIDKKKSDSLTLNSASNRRHGDLHMKTRNDIERQLRLQKSLSEECEDLGVGEPSTSELFPEAELSFDNNSPIAFDALNSNHCSSSLSSTSIGGRSAFEFPNQRTSAHNKMVKKLPKRKSNDNTTQNKQTKDANKSNCSGGSSNRTSNNNENYNFDEIPSIGLNHSAIKDLNDSNDCSALDDDDSTANAYSIKLTLLNKY